VGGLTVVDLGRLAVGDSVSESWLSCSDAAVLVVRGDASCAVHLRDRGARLADVFGGRIGIVAVGSGYTSHEIAAFAGVTAIADIPFDPAAAEVAAGAAGSVRRLDRSLLWMSAVRMAASVATQVDGGWQEREHRLPDGESGPGSDPSAPGGDSGRVDGDPVVATGGRLRGLQGYLAPTRLGGRGVRARRGIAQRTAAGTRVVGS